MGIEVLFWLSLALIFFTYVGYPLILVVLGIKKKQPLVQRGPAISVTILIPVYNEEGIIRQKIENSLSIDYPSEKFEIIIASESNDKTNEIVREYKDQGVKLLTYSGREGKQKTIFRAIPQCSGEIIVLTDANGMFRPNAIRRIVEAFCDPAVGCVSGELKYVDSRNGVATTEGIYWKYELWVKKLESQVGSVLGANGSIYAIRKALYYPLTENRGDDFELPIAVALRGHKVVLASLAVSEEEFSAQNSHEFSRRVRIVSWVWNSAWILFAESLKRRRWLIAFQLISHKMLRWLVGLFLGIAFVSNLFLLDHTLYIYPFLLQVIFYAMAIWGCVRERGSKCLGRWVKVAYYFCVIHLAAIIGIIQAISGRQKPIWEKVR